MLAMTMRMHGKAMWHEMKTNKDITRKLIFIVYPVRYNWNLNHRIAGQKSKNKQPSLSRALLFFWATKSKWTNKMNVKKKAINKYGMEIIKKKSADELVYRLYGDSNDLIECLVRWSVTHEYLCGKSVTRNRNKYWNQREALSTFYKYDNSMSSFATIFVVFADPGCYFFSHCTDGLHCIAMPCINV